MNAILLFNPEQVRNVVMGALLLPVAIVIVIGVAYWLTTRD